LRFRQIELVMVSLGGGGAFLRLDTPATYEPRCSPVFLGIRSERLGRFGKPCLNPRRAIRSSPHLLFPMSKPTAKKSPAKKSAKAPAAAAPAAPVAPAANNFPKLHNAMWPGLVGKGGAGAEASIDLDTMLDYTAKAEVNGVKFDGVDLFLYNPHVDIDISDDGIKISPRRFSRAGLWWVRWWLRFGLMAPPWAMQPNAPIG
jgi:hypothetical protein